MARPKGERMDPQLGQLVKAYCQEIRVPQGDLAEEIGISYPTLSRGINGHRVDPASKRRIEAMARQIASEHPEIFERVKADIDFSKPIHIIAKRLADRFGLEIEQAKKIAQNVTRGLKVIV